MKELSARGKSVWRLYLWLHGWFALLYGAFASYCYLYLGTQVRLAGGMEYLPKSLLPLMGGMLLLEAISAPFAGAYADAMGRKAAVKRGLHLLALSYALLATLPLIRSALAADSGFWVLWIGMAGIGLMSVAAAFHANALDAWFVDELLDSPVKSSLLRVGNSRPDLHRYFAIQSQVFGTCLLAGGVFTLWLGKALADSARKEPIAMLSPGSSIWVLGALLALGIARRLAERVGATVRTKDAKGVPAKAKPSRAPANVLGSAARQPAGVPPVSLAMSKRLEEVLRSRELVRALLLSSFVYFCGLAVIYFLPELLRERGGDALGNPTAAWLTEHYWVFYVGIGLTRIIGPTLGLRAGPRKPCFDETPMGKLNNVNVRGFAFRKRQAWYWGALGFGGVTVAGIAFLAAPGKYFLIPLALIVLAKLAIEAFKPVQASYLNELAAKSSRAFSLSLATPFGSAALGCLALLFVGLQGASPGSLPLEQLGFAIPLAFSVLGLITLLLLRAVTRPARSAALGEDWKHRRKRIREELRMEGELPMSSANDEGDFVRPLGAGDLPTMRPGNGLAPPQVIRAGRRTQKPPYLRQPEPSAAPRTTATPPPAPPKAKDATPAARPRDGRPNLRIVYSRPTEIKTDGTGEG